MAPSPSESVPYGRADDVPSGDYYVIYLPREVIHRPCVTWNWNSGGCSTGVNYTPGLYIGAYKLCFWALNVQCRHREKDLQPRNED